MAIKTRAVLKTYFENGDFPNEEEFWDLLDSMVSKADDGVPVAFVAVPATTDSSGAAGQMAYDDDYLYVCTSLNKWKRAPLSEW